MRSLRTRLMLNTLLPLLIILPVVGFVLTYLLETQVFLGNITNELTRQAVLVADAASTTVEIWQDPLRAQSFVTKISPRLTAKVMLLDPTGHLIVSSDPQDSYLIGQVFSMPDAELLLTREVPAEVSYDKNKISDIVVPVISTGGSLLGYVRLANPLSSLYERSQTLRQIMLFVVVAGLLVGVLLAWLLAQDVERPLKQVTEAVYSLANGEKLTLLEEGGTRETRFLLRAFNTLIERLQTLEESRRRLLANLVHELGRPIGSLRSATQALMSGADDDPALRAELLEGMDAEFGRLQHTLDDLARLHDQVLGPLDLKIEPFAPNDWLTKLLPTWSRDALEKKLEWEENIDPNLPVVEADPDRLAQAFENLLANAIRYTPSGGTISVRAATRDEDLLLEVCDSGPGISAEEREKIFTPFYRGQPGKRFPEGMGLGLSIARDLVEAHQGELLVDSQPGKGSRFTICVPLKQDPVVED